MDFYQSHIGVYWILIFCLFETELRKHSECFYVDDDASLKSANSLKW